MWFSLSVLIIILVVFAIAFVLAKRNGQQSARIEALKREVKERQRANEIVSAVRNMDINDVDERLRNISNK